MTSPRSTPPAPLDLPEPAESPILVFSRADWTTLMPKLLRAAGDHLRKLGWAEGEHHRPGALEEQELVNRAVECYLAGERRLLPGAGANERILFRCLRRTMRSIAVNLRTSAGIARRAAREVDEQADGGPTPSRHVAARALVQRVGRAIEGDEEAVAVEEAMAEGHTEREEIAEALGWTIERVKVVRKRMSRRLARAHVSLDDDDTGEQEPESKP